MDNITKDTNQYILQLIQSISMRLDRERNLLLKEVNLTSQQFQLLKNISMRTIKNELISLNELSSLYGYEIPAVSRLSKRMADTGLVIKESSNGKPTYLGLTKKGKELLLKTKNSIKNYNKNLLHTITEHQKKELVSILKKLD